jgi:arylsulfatase A-like enzyme
MTKDSSSAPQRRTLLKGAGAGIGLFLAWQYGSALSRLANSTGGMDNKFSKLAREDYLTFLIGQNLLVLVAYALLWISAMLLIVPALSFIVRRSPWRGRGSVFVPAFLLAMLLHGYFMLRLIHSRPYFLTDAEFGKWYYGILKAPPESWQPAINTGIFSILPWLALAAAGGWWIWSVRAQPRVRLVVASVGLLVAASAAIAAIPRNAESQASKGENRPMNIIVIGSDSLRGDRLGYAGYRPGRTDGAAAAGVSPNIDAWAQEAVRFERCYVPMASTLESAVSMLSSTYPHTNGIRHMYPGREAVDASNKVIRPIASVLREKGYDTAAIGDWCAGYYEMMPLGFEDISVSSFDNFRIYMSQAVFMAHFVVPLYFDNELGYTIFPQVGSFAQFVTPEVVTRRVEDKLAAQAKSGRPFFWHVFYSCNHLPYRCAEPYNTMFTDPAYQGKNRTGVDFDIDEFVSGTALEDKMGALPDADIRQIRALYDGCTRQFDTCFGRIREALRRHGMEDNTIVVITADHGDDLYEPGVTLTHGLGFNGADHSFHVPLAIRVPGLYPASIPEQVRSIDLSPTLLDLVDTERPASWEGRSMAGWMRGHEKPLDLPYYGETSFPFIQFKVPGVERPHLPPMDELTTIEPGFNHQFVMKREYDEPVRIAKQRCLRTRNWKVVCTPCSQGNRHFGLFHIAEDPDCRNDLSEERPEILAPMEKALTRWIDDHAETPVAGIFPQGEP